MASTYFDLTAANAALKELIDGQVVENLVYEDNPLLALVPKKTDFGGKYKPIPIISAVSQGRSAVFASAQANQSAASIESFLLTRKSDYSIGTIDNQTMLASKTDKFAFLEGAKVVVDSAIRSITLSLASKLFRSGTGSIGQVNASGLSTGVITLLDPNQVTQFEVNMVLQITTGTTDGATPRAAKGYVIAVDRTAGTVTVASSGLGGAAATPAAWAASEYLLQDGDSNAALSGLAAWLPATAPTGSDNFYGVNRSVDPVRLAGVRYSGTSQSIEEALIDASMLCGREGGRPDYAVMSFASFSALDKSLGSKVQYVDLKAGEVGFRGIVINGAKGPIKVFADRSCPGSTAYLLQMNTWTLQSLGDAPQIFRYGDGLEMLRVYNADAAEMRCGYYANLACNAPGWNATVALSG